MALQDDVGQAWLHSLGDERAPDDGRRREAVLWRVHEERSASRRSPAPSRRASRCHMPRRVFVAVALGWVAAVGTLLALVVAARWMG
jgi:hypothetical protein